MAKQGKTTKGRRRFLGDMATGLGCAGLFSMLSFSLTTTTAKGATLLRPPGALDEDAFLNACSRCGLCVRDCPYDTLRLANYNDQVRNGTPVFEARKIPCEMCDDIPCVVACPTGALDHGLTDIEQSRMGLAVLIDHETCIAFQGLRCEVCYNVCPVQGKAITLELQNNTRTGRHALFLPTVHSNACTGCGKCEYACILTDEPAIKVLPIDLAKGSDASHYQLGWEEQQKHGRQQDLYQHEYNLPKGKSYDYQGRGLIDENQQDDSPFSSNPLDSLNQRTNSLEKEN